MCGRRAGARPFCLCRMSCVSACPRVSVCADITPLCSRKPTQRWIKPLKGWIDPLDGSVYCGVDRLGGWLGAARDELIRGLDRSIRMVGWHSGWINPLEAGSIHRPGLIHRRWTCRRWINPVPGLDQSRRGSIHPPSGSTQGRGLLKIDLWGRTRLRPRLLRASERRLTGYAYRQDAE